jgi:hypothetical protein
LIQSNILFLYSVIGFDSRRSHLPIEVGSTPSFNANWLMDKKFCILADRSLSPKEFCCFGYERLFLKQSFHNSCSDIKPFKCGLTNVTMAFKKEVLGWFRFISKFVIACSQTPNLSANCLTSRSKSILTFLTKSPKFFISDGYPDLKRLLGKVPVI